MVKAMIGIVVLLAAIVAGIWLAKESLFGNRFAAGMTGLICLFGLLITCLLLRDA